MGALLTVLGILEIPDRVWPSGPEITPSPPSETASYDSPLSIRNPNKFYDLKNVTLWCARYVKMTKPFPTESVLPSGFADSGDLAAGEVKQINCPAFSSPNADRVVLQQMRIHYRVGLLHLNSDPVMFNWRSDLRPPRWMEGMEMCMADKCETPAALIQKAFDDIAKGKRSATIGWDTRDMAPH